MWIVPNIDNQITIKDASHLFENKVLSISKPMSARSLKRYFTKRERYLASKASNFPKGILDIDTKCLKLKVDSLVETKPKDFSNLSSIEEWNAHIKFMKLEFVIREKLNSSSSKAWGTPTTRDYKDALNKKEVTPMKCGTRRLSLCVLQALHIENYKGVYNPRWVETVMGLPVGWVKAR